MTEIVKYIPNALTIEESEILRASQGVKIKDAVIDGALTNQSRIKIETAITRALINLNQKKIFEKEMDFNSFIASLVSMLAEKHPFLTLDELSKAILYGSIGEFKKEQETLYLSVANINSWIKCYLEQKKQPLMIKNKPELKEKELTENEKEEIIKNGIKRRFQEFKETGDCDDFGNVGYEYLDKKGLIFFTADRKKEFMKQAEENIKREKKMQISKSTPVEVRDINKFLITLETNKNPIITEAKKIALKTFFAELIEMDEGLEL
jgi:hypothetical protein